MDVEYLRKKYSVRVFHEYYQSSCNNIYKMNNTFKSAPEAQINAAEAASLNPSVNPVKGKPGKNKTPRRASNPFNEVIKEAKSLEKRYAGAEELGGGEISRTKAVKKAIDILVSKGIIISTDDYNENAFYRHFAKRVALIISNVSLIRQCEERKLNLLKVAFITVWKNVSKVGKNGKVRDEVYYLIEKGLDVADYKDFGGDLNFFPTEDGNVLRYLSDTDTVRLLHGYSENHDNCFADLLNMIDDGARALDDNSAHTPTENSGKLAS